MVFSRARDRISSPEFSAFRPVTNKWRSSKAGLAEAVIEALPRSSVEDLIENSYSRDYWVELQNAWRQYRGQELLVESPQRRALMELQTARVRFRTNRESSGIVEIVAEASNPRVALDIANTYVDVLVARTRSFNIDDAKSTREYLTQQTGQVAEALNASETTLSQFTLSKGGVRVPERFSETAHRLSQLESSIAEVQTNKNMSQTRLAGLRSKLEAMPGAPPRATPAAPAPSPFNAGRLRAKLSSLEAQLVEAKGNYPDEHPRLRSLRQQIADVQRDLGDAVKESTSADLTGSSVPAQDRAAFADMVAALETSVVSLTAQESALREQAANLRKNLVGLSRDELEYRRLASEAETNRKLATMLQDKLGAARIREQGEMNAVKVIDPPGAPNPAPNERRLKFGIALALSFAVGVAGPRWSVLQPTIQTGRCPPDHRTAAVRRAPGAVAAGAVQPAGRKTVTSLRKTTSSSWTRSGACASRFSFSPRKCRSTGSSWPAPCRARGSPLWCTTSVWPLPRSASA
jgi:uncharacterized protein involved in exopolysaccharide biosynthesis